MYLSSIKVDLCSKAKESCFRFYAEDEKNHPIFVWHVTSLIDKFQALRRWPLWKASRLIRFEGSVMEMLLTSLLTLCLDTVTCMYTLRQLERLTHNIFHTCCFCAMKVGSGKQGLREKQERRASPYVYGKEAESLIYDSYDARTTTSESAACHSPAYTAQCQHLGLCVCCRSIGAPPSVAPPEPQHRSLHLLTQHTLPASLPLRAPLWCAACLQAALGRLGLELWLLQR